MNKNTGIIIGVVTLILIVGGVYASMQINKKEVVINQKTDDSATMKKESENIVKDEVVSNEDIMKKDELVAKGLYEAYSSEKIARAETGDVVIFFHASWCPSCRGLNSDIESNMNSIPAGVSILKADYDKETELKKKYGVTSQHTLVQVDKDGNMIKKWSGGSTLSNVLSQIN